MDNMTLYNGWRTVPQSAQKTIGGGRLKGMTDINPQWRIERLTEAFGRYGEGWGIDNVCPTFEPSGTGEIACFVSLVLWWRDEEGVRHDCAGVGGAMYVAKEKDGLRANDEAVKMAVTDGISVACKCLGMGADIYWAAGRTKYSTATDAVYTCKACGKTISDVRCNDGSVIAAKDFYKVYGGLCPDCLKAKKHNKEESNE